MQNGPKIPPHDLMAEQAILGGCFYHPDKIPIVADLVRPGDFYREAHQYIAEALFELGPEADLVTVSDWLKRKGILEKYGGDDYLSSLAETGISAGIEQHCAIVVEHSRRRQVIQASQFLGESAFQDDCDLDLILTDHSQLLHDIQQQGFKDHETPQETITRALKLIEERSKSKTHTVGYLTGFNVIDSRLHGLEPKSTYYLKALSKTGKSSLALHICGNMVSSYPGKIVYFSLESTKLALILRRLSRLSNIPLTRLRIGKLYDESEWQRLTEAANEASENLLIMDGAQFQTFEKLSSFCTALANHDKLLMIVIDYLQLLSSAKPFRSLHEMYRSMVNQLNFLAKDLDCPLMILSQVAESGDAKGKAKESRDIETNADHVWMLTREDQEATTAKIIGEKAKDDGPWSGYLNFNRFVMRWSDGVEPGEKKEWWND